MTSLTICVCIRNGEAHVDGCFEAIFREVRGKDVAVLAVDHSSTDATRDLLTKWEPEGLAVHTFAGKGIGAVRDFAWRQSETPRVAFIDVDCRMLPGWLAAVNQVQDEPHLAAVGGENHVPQGEGVFYEALALLLPTFIGGHGSPLNRPVSESGEVEHLPTLNVVYRRSALDAVNGFNADFRRAAEDLDVSYRLIAAGFHLRSCPGMAVEHRLRATVNDWLANMFVYGRARVFFFAMHPRAIRAKYAAPIVVVLGYAILPFVFPAGHIVGTALALIPAWLRGRFRARVFFSAVAITALTHFAYGAGMLFQLVAPRSK